MYCKILQAEINGLPVYKINILESQSVTTYCVPSGDNHE